MPQFARKRFCGAKINLENMTTQEIKFNNNYQTALRFEDEVLKMLKERNSIRQTVTCLGEETFLENEGEIMAFLKLKEYLGIHLTLQQIIRLIKIRDFPFRNCGVCNEELHYLYDNTNQLYYDSNCGCVTYIVDPQPRNESDLNVLVSNEFLQKKLQEFYAKDISEGKHLEEIKPNPKINNMNMEEVQKKMDIQIKFNKQKEKDLIEYKMPEIFDRKKHQIKLFDKSLPRFVMMAEDEGKVLGYIDTTESFSDIVKNPKAFLVDPIFSGEIKQSSNGDFCSDKFFGTLLKLNS